MNAVVKKQRGGSKRQEKPRAPVFIVHLDDGGGLALCGLPPPWPGENHRLAIEAKPQDVCRTCAWFQIERQKLDTTPAVSVRLTT